MNEPLSSNPRLAKLIAQARGSSGPWFDELVAEIERLTAELMQARSGLDAAALDALQAERDRLRAALERARAYVRAHVEYGPLEYIARNVDEIAREALAGAPSETTE